MEITQKRNVNIRETVENTVSGNREFHFYVDELAPDDSMPTYVGKADEKYHYHEMDDDFFEFLERKALNNGIYIRLVFSIAEEKNGKTVFKLGAAGVHENFRPKDMNKVFKFHYADFGIKIKGRNVTFGASIDYEDDGEIFFHEFGYDDGNGQFLSLDNPLNQHVLKIMEEMIK